MIADISAWQRVAEKLDDIEALVMRLESAVGEGVDPRASVPLLFRDFHNLKSMLSTEGLESTARLVHKAESCLDALRSGKGSFSPGLMDGLIAVVDHARSVVRRQEDADDPSIASQIGRAHV